MKMLWMSVLVAGSYLITGCSPNVTEHQLADGFFIKSTGPLFENSGGSRKLYYQSPSGAQKVVWKYVADPVLVHNGIAVFIGDWQGTDEYAGYTYFAEKENGPVVRLRKAILTRAAQKDGALPEEYLKRYGDSQLSAKDNIVRFQLSCRIGNNNPNLAVDLTWNEISEIVNGVIKTGKPRRDKLNGITYLE